MFLCSSAVVGPWRRGCLVIGLGLGRGLGGRFDPTTGRKVDFALDRFGTLRRLTVLSSVPGSVSSAEAGRWRRGCLVIGLRLARAFLGRFDFPLEVDWVLEMEMLLGAPLSEFTSMASSKAKFLVAFRGPLRRLTVSSSDVGSLE